MKKKNKNKNSEEFAKMNYLMLTSKKAGNCKE